jgi:hypothetical protein
MNKPIAVLNMQQVLVPGSALVRAVYERVSAMRTLYDKVLKDLSTQLEESSENVDDPFPKMAALLVVLEQTPEDMSVHAMMIQAKVSKAAKLQQDIAELSRVAKHVDQAAMYTLSWDEAKRYGL